jgi:hypothetical protein
VRLQVRVGKEIIQSLIASTTIPKTYKVHFRTGRGKPTFLTCGVARQSIGVEAVEISYTGNHLGQDSLED